MVHATAFALRQRNLNVYVSNSAIRFSTIPSVNSSDGELVISLHDDYNLTALIGKSSGLPTVTENLSSTTFTEDDPNLFNGPDFVRAFTENGTRSFGEMKGIYFR